jgi:hypothetical protein
MGPKAQAIVDQINKESREKYGELCPKCEVYKAFCWCENKKEKEPCSHPKESIKKFDSGYSQCTLCHQIF